MDDDLHQASIAFATQASRHGEARRPRPITMMSVSDMSVGARAAYFFISFCSVSMRPARPPKFAPTVEA